MLTWPLITSWDVTLYCEAKSLVRPRWLRYCRWKYYRELPSKSILPFPKWKTSSALPAMPWELQ